MKTKYLDEEILELTRISKIVGFSKKGKERLIEFKAIKQALNIQNVSVSDFEIRKYASDQAQEYTDCDGEQSEIKANIIGGAIWVKNKLTTH